MTNRHGSFIWYELMTSDAAGAKAFYDAVVGWDIDAATAYPGMDYRMIKLAGGGFAGGVLPLTDEMRQHGARPTWLGYVGVDDVDATIQALEHAGGGVLMPASTIEGVGRMAMVRDPAGSPFYVMRGASNEESTAFSTDQAGHCGWNELSTADPDPVFKFYSQLFGWLNHDSMDMGEHGQYRFLDHHGTRIGALYGAGPGSSPGWRYYFRVASITAADDAIKAHGGQVTMGPQEVPGGDHIVIGRDPQGADFALVGGQ